MYYVRPIGTFGRAQERLLVALVEIKGAKEKKV
jgi:hypothetical protein